MLTEDLSAYLQDFGVAAVWAQAPSLSGWNWKNGASSINAATFSAQTQATSLVIFDQPAQDVVDRRVQSIQYRIVFPATAFAGIAHGDALLIDGTYYLVLQSGPIDDGVWWDANLEEV